MYPTSIVKEPVGLAVGNGSALANVPLILVLVALIGANYGANLAVFPAMTRDFSGLKNFA